MTVSQAPADPLVHLLQTAFRHADFRPFQEPVCRAVMAGQDALMVMPTGAGKSLCFQLPGLARGGTTLVISPLIALIEDQIAKLCALGLRAERIHSGRDRERSREVCQAYLQGGLDYLFIAPERLSVPRFPEMLAKRTPTLVAIDEAHCISQWGHDFRPEYRMIGRHLPLLRPAPVIALTATATVRVQDDIITQLSLPAATRFIHGFRRTNIAIEAAQVPVPERAAVVQKVLSQAKHRPAIVYAPTRKVAELLAESLAVQMSCAAYHAGMAPEKREQVQSAFIGGRLDVVVATIAFGMGIDKANVRTVIHAALPSTLEGYYQEIGRAGRDGQPARALLLYSYADLRTHEFFFQRDYPAATHLLHVFQTLNQGPSYAEDLCDALNMPIDLFETVINKLRAHGALWCDEDGILHARHNDWQTTYAQQIVHKEQSLRQIKEFADQEHGCRMVRLTQHFGDREDDKSCGICDACAPSKITAQSVRKVSTIEAQLALQILATLSKRDGLTARQLHEQCALGQINRPPFERLLRGLSIAGLLELSEQTFRTSDGQEVTYHRVYATTAGRVAGIQRISGAQVVNTLPAKVSTRKPRAPRNPRARVRDY